jgi:hypothetical protein
MSDSLLQILEVLNEVLAEQPEGGEGDVAVVKGATTRGRPRKSTKKIRTDVLDVDRIVANLILSKQEKKTKENLSTKDSFSVIRRFNDDKINSINDCQTLVEAVQSYFISEEVVEGSCKDISTIMSRLMVNSAYQNILQIFNESTAGFVNENLVAELLNGTSIPTGTKLEDSNANDIADVAIGGGKYGISLKTKKKGVSGSLRDLSATLGVPFRIYDENDNLVFENSNTNPKYDKLFYLFFGKPQEGKKRGNVFSITAVEITRESVIQIFKNFLMSEFSEEGYFVTDNEAMKQAESSAKTFLGATAGYYKGIFAKKLGIADHAARKFSEKETVTLNQQQAGFLQESLVASLNLLNDYLGIIVDSVTGYSVNPTPKILTNPHNRLDYKQRRKLEITTTLSRW